MILLAKSTQFFFFLTARPIMVMAAINVRLLNPIMDRLFGRFKLLGKLNNRTCVAS